MADETVKTDEVVDETTDEVVDDETTTTTDGETVDETPVAEDDLPEEETKEAKALFKLLKDPSTQKETLRVLAERAGLLKSDTSPKQQEKTVKTILSILEEDLGDNLKFIAPQLAKSLEKILEQERQTQTERFTQLEADRVSNSVEIAKDKLSRETKGDSGKLWPKMESLSDKIKPAEGSSPYEYLKILYTLASADGQKSTIKREVNDKINKNAKDVGSRLQTSSTASGKGSEKIPKTLKGIVEQNYQKLLKGE